MVPLMFSLAAKRSQEVDHLIYTHNSVKQFRGFRQVVNKQPPIQSWVLWTYYLLAPRLLLEPFIFCDMYIIIIGMIKIFEVEN